MLAIIALILLVVLIGLMFKYPEYSLLFFFTAGTFKALLMVKFGFFRVFDLTVMSAVLVLIFMSYKFVREGGQIKGVFSAPLFLYLLLGILLLFGLGFTSAPRYGFEKSSRFITFGLIAFVSPLFFGSSVDGIKRVLLMIVLAAVVISVGTIVAPDIVVVREQAIRGTFLGGNPLTVGLIAGMGMVICFPFTVMKSKSTILRIINLVLIGVMGVAVIISGSRGAFLGVGLIWCLVLYICRKGISKVWQPVIISILVILVITAFIKMPGEITERISNMFKGKYEARQAGEDRFVLFNFVLERFAESPLLGHGTGAFAVDRGGQDVMDYPHNMFLEALYEQGIVGFVVITVFLWMIFSKWRQAAKLVYYNGMDLKVFETVHIAGLLFLFLFLQAMKSGDFNGNRWMFLAAGMILAVHKCVKGFENEILPESNIEEQLYQQELQIEQYS